MNTSKVFILTYEHRKYLNRLKNLAVNWKNDLSRFHAPLVPHRVNYNLLTLWKIDENGLKRSHLHQSSTKWIIFIDFW